MTPARGTWVLVMALSSACGGTPPPAQERSCDSPFEYHWVANAPEATFDDPPSCEGVAFIRRPDGGLTLEVNGESRGATEAPDAVAFRDATGVGWVSADWRGRYLLRAPGSSSSILAGSAPRDALQWGLTGVYVGPDGWWLVAWASWVGDHEERRPAITQVFFVARASMRAVPVAWPSFDPAPTAIVPRRGGLDVAVEAQRGPPRAFEVRRRPDCMPATETVVSPPPRCATWPGQTGMCFGRC